MFYVYVLKSYEIEWYYVGLTANIENRVLRHNRGREKATKHYRPFTLVFAQEFENRASARNIEKYLKISSNKESLIGLIAGVVKLVDTQS